VIEYLKHHNPTAESFAHAEAVLKRMMSMHGTGGVPKTVDLESVKVIHDLEIDPTLTATALNESSKIISQNLFSVVETNEIGDRITNILQLD
jgi:hypothetical protein